MSIKPRDSEQHQPLRTPQKWEDVRSLVIQIDKLFDEIYRRVNKLERAVRALEEEE